MISPLIFLFSFCYATFILKEGIPDSEIFLVQIHFLEIWRHYPAEIEFVNIRVFKLSTRLASWQFLECDSVQKNKCVSTRGKLNKDGQSISGNKKVSKLGNKGMQLCLYNKYKCRTRLCLSYIHFFFITYYISSIFSVMFLLLSTYLFCVFWLVGPWRILHFNLSLLRSGAKLRSLGSGGSADLNVMVSELKDMRESAKGFMNAQNSGNLKIF